jgi:hypothetical protein
VPLAAYWHLLRDNRNMRLLWSAQIVSELGDWFYSVAIYSSPAARRWSRSRS